MSCITIIVRLQSTMVGELANRTCSQHYIWFRTGRESNPNPSADNDTNAIQDAHLGWNYLHYVNGWPVAVEGYVNANSK